MTTAQENSRPKDRSLLFNRTLYGAFIALGIYFLLANQDVASAMSTLGIALIFDPFNAKITWNNRPLYQRVWLFVHVGIVLIMVAYLLMSSLNII